MPYLQLYVYKLQGPSTQYRTIIDIISKSWIEIQYIVTVFTFLVNSNLIGRLMCYKRCDFDRMYFQLTSVWWCCGNTGAILRNMTFVYSLSQCELKWYDLNSRLNRYMTTNLIEKQERLKIFTKKYHFIIYMINSKLFN
jgi:hypothetical protein